MVQATPSGQPPAPMATCRHIVINETRWIQYLLKCIQMGQIWTKWANWSKPSLSGQLSALMATCCKENRVKGLELSQGGSHGAKMAQATPSGQPSPPMATCHYIVINETIWIQYLLKCIQMGPKWTKWAKWSEPTSSGQLFAPRASCRIENHVNCRKLSQAGSYGAKMSQATPSGQPPPPMATCRHIIISETMWIQYLLKCIQMGPKWTKWAKWSEPTSSGQLFEPMATCRIENHVNGLKLSQAGSYGAKMDVSSHPKWPATCAHGHLDVCL